MPRYSEERKAATLKKLLPPQSRSVNSVADEDGISPQTLYHWLKQCREQGVAVHGHQKQADQWSAEDKLAIVIEAGLSGRSCRRIAVKKGYLPSRSNSGVRIACRALGAPLKASAR